MNTVANTIMRAGALSGSRQEQPFCSRTSRNWRWLAAALCWLLLTLAAAPTAQAQEPQIATAREWTPVAAIPDHFPDALPPILVADANRTVHAFVTLPLTDDPNEFATAERGIFYRQWTLEGGWTEPIDIMLTPLKQQARIKSVFLDDADIMHMIFYGGDEQEANIYYSWSPASTAGAAASWSPPLAIGGNAVEGIIAAITGDGGDHLVVVYSGDLGEGNSMYAIYSDDAGVTWSEPELVYSTYGRDLQPFDFNWHLGESGALHMVWNVTDKKGQNVTAFYAQLKDITRRAWSTPVTIDDNVGLGLAALNVIEYQGKVMMIYNNGKGEEVSPVMWFKMSTDGGQTFSTPIQPFSNHIGRNGAVSFVVDSNGVLQCFFGQRIPGGLSNGVDWLGMWNSVWDGNSWGAVTPVVSGPPSNAFDPYDARAVVSQGNVILLTYRTDPGRDITGSWYTSRQLDAPELPVKPLAAPIVLIGSESAGSESAGSETPTLTIDLSTAAEFASTEPAAESGDQSFALSQQGVTVTPSSPAAPIVIALLPTILFIAAALSFAGVRRRHS